jgi:hypothetical protein
VSVADDASSSAFTLSLNVEHIPCGSPLIRNGYFISRTAASAWSISAQKRSRPPDP